MQQECGLELHSCLFNYLVKKSQKIIHLHLWYTTNVL